MMRRNGHAWNWSAIVLATGTMLLVGCDSTDARGGGGTNGSETSSGGVGQLSSGGAQNKATGGRTTALSNGGQTLTGGTTTSSSGGQSSTGGTTTSSSGGQSSTGGTTTSSSGGQLSTGGAIAVPTGGKASTSGGMSNGGSSAQTGGTNAAGQGGMAGSPPTGNAGAAGSGFKCKSDNDCCAVVDPCYTTMTVVGLPDKAALEAQIAAHPKTYCTSCIPPAVQVTCVNGQCLGYKVGTGTWPPSGLSGTHCGLLPLSTGGTIGVSASAERAVPIIGVFGGSAGTLGTTSAGGASTGGVHTGGTSSTLGVSFGCG